jgi:hypothetical protein
MITMLSSYWLKLEISPIFLHVTAEQCCGAGLRSRLLALEPKLQFVVPALAPASFYLSKTRRIVLEKNSWLLENFFVNC